MLFDKLLNWIIKMKKYLTIGSLLL